MKNKKISNMDYAYAVGRIRALEVHLFKQKLFEEAIDAGLENALKLFVEHGLYTDELLKVRDSELLEKILKQQMSGLKAIMRGLILDKGLLYLIENPHPLSIQSIVNKISCEFIRDYLRYIVDMHNIKTFLRLYIMKGAQEELKEKIIDAGFIEKKSFLSLYGRDIAAFLEKIEYVFNGRGQCVNYASFLREPIERLLKEMEFLYLEKAADDFLISALMPAKYLSFGPEPVIAYYFAKINEINLVRMIILAKINDVDSMLIKRRLNYAYA